MSTGSLDTSSERAFIRATEIARNLQSQYVTVEMLALALIENKAIESAIIICGVEPASVYKEIQDQLDLEVQQNLTRAPTLTRSLNNVGTRASHQMAQAGKKVMGVHHLMASVLGEDDSFSKFIFESNGVDRQTFLKAFYQNRPIDEEKIQEIDPMTGMPSNRSSDPLEDYCVNLNKMAKDGKIDRLIGRETEVHRTIQILSRRRKNNPILVGEPGVGKAQPLSSKVLTPSGFIEMGNITVGDSVVANDGTTSTVTGVYPQGIKDVFEITFSDGRTAESCDEHLWDIYGKYDEQYITPDGWRARKSIYKTMPLKDIMEKMASNKGFQPKIPLYKPNNNIQTNTLPIDPWLFGFLLGDGSFVEGKMGTFSTGDQEILNIINERLIEGYEIKSTNSSYDYYIKLIDANRGGVIGHNHIKNNFAHIYRQAIVDLGLRGARSYEKFIPESYKNSSVSDKIELIAGLVDSDGHVTKTGVLSITTTSKQMSHDIQEIIWSIGGIARISINTNTGYKKDGNFIPCKDAYTIHIRYHKPNDLSKLSRKKDLLPGENYQYKDLKLKITSIKKVSSQECQCIMIDHPNHLYVTDNYVITHNTAIAEGLAYKIVKGEVPKHIGNAVVYSLDMGSLLAGTKFRGEFEERLKDVINAIKKLNEDGQAILFIDEIHMIIGAGAGSAGAMDASNILKPALAKGEIHCIGSTTYDEFNKHFEKDSALKRRFKKVDISEPSSDETKDILLGLSKYFEEFHEIKFTNGALFAAVDLSVKHIHDNKLPDKAIDVIDEAGAAQRLLDDGARLSVIDVTQIEEVVAQTARIPEITVKKDDSETLKVLSATMKNFVFGQDDPIDELTRSIKISRAGLRELHKPVGSFLFAGPTGVGKTEMAKQVARILGIHYERIDMSEYMEKHTVSKLIGAPAGYVGHDDGDGRLIEAVDKHPHMVLLLDEVEKAHPDIFNILLQVMDDAKLTSGRGKIARFENVIIIMTSNAGVAASQKSNVGFGAGMNDGAMTDAVNKMFSPEFRNRLDKIMYFNRLSPETMICIVDKFLNELQVQLDEKEIILEVNSESKDWLSIKGYDPLFGARPLSRVIQENIKDSMADEILFGDLKYGGVAMVKVENDELVLTTRESSKLPTQATIEPIIEEK